MVIRWKWIPHQEDGVVVFMMRPAGVGCIQWNIIRRYLRVVARRKEEIFSAFTFINTTRPYIFDGRLPIIHYASVEDAVIRRWNLQHDWASSTGIKKRHEIDHIRVGSQGLIFPIQQA